MKRVKKVEIIADTVETRQILTELEPLGVSSYTILPTISGRGARGTKDDDGLTGVLTNSYLLIICSPDQSNIIADKIRPRLKDSGGICVISDAEWVDH